METVFIAILLAIGANSAAVFPPFFRDLEKLSSRYPMVYPLEESEARSFKQHVIESSSSGKGTLIMKKGEWKLEWCKAKSFNQTVGQGGCISKRIPNKYCYGQCNSIYIPGERYLEGCSSCRPKSYSWETVTLFCPFLAKRRLHKRVQKIYSCHCFDCPK